jgi:oxygen-independent coproporphyrinogen III oxidase
VQNVKESSNYIASVESGRLPVERAYILSRDERFTREVINSIMCQERLDLRTIGLGEGMPESEVRERLADGLQLAVAFAEDGLCRVEDAVLTVTPAGRLAVRNIAFLFDPLLGTGQGRYSQTV